MILQRYGDGVVNIVVDRRTKLYLKVIRTSYVADARAKELMTQQSDLYFFDQCFKRRKYKRYRKPQELLPFSLRLTGLSGAVKVEAYLKQQQQKAGDGKQGQQTKGIAGDKDDANESSSRVSLQPKDHETDEGVRKLHAGKAFINLPEIAVHGVHSLPAIRSYEQLEGDDEEEDTQRFLFEENKFAAPNLLAQLGRLIDQLHEQQLEELDEIQSSSGQFYSRSSTPPLEADRQSLLSETLRSGGVLIPLPDDLHNKLRGNFEELSSNAVHAHREWQTASYREQAILQKRIGIMSDSQTYVDPKSAVNGDQSKTNDDKLAGVRGVDSKDFSKRKQSSAIESVIKIDSSDDQRRESILGVNTPTTEVSNTDVTASRRDSSRLSFYVSRPMAKTRIEKFKMFSDKGSNGECPSLLFAH